MRQASERSLPLFIRGTLPATPAGLLGPSIKGPGAADTYFAPLDNSGKLARCQEGHFAPE